MNLGRHVQMNRCAQIRVAPKGRREFLIHNKLVSGEELVVHLSHYGQSSDSIHVQEGDAQLTVKC